GVAARVVGLSGSHSTLVDVDRTVEVDWWERVASTDIWAVGDRIGQHAKTEALPVWRVRRREQVSLRLCVAAGSAAEVPRNYEEARIEEAARADAQGGH